jgi:hypothetical protein
MIYENLVANHGYAFKMSMPYNADTAFNAKSVKVLGSQNDIWFMKIGTRSDNELYVLAEEGLDEAYVECVYSTIATLYKHYDTILHLI